MHQLSSNGESVSKPLEQAPVSEGVKAALGQLSLRAMLVIVLVLAINLAVFQRFSQSAGLAFTFALLAIALHLIASHFGRQALGIGNSIGARDQSMCLPGPFQRHELGEQTEDDLSDIQWLVTTPRSNYRWRGCYFCSSCLGVVTGPWVCFGLMRHIAVDVTHPLAFAAICVAGAILGTAVFLVVCAALRLLSTAIQSLRFLPQR